MKNHSINRVKKAAIILAITGAAVFFAMKKKPELETIQKQKIEMQLKKQEYDKQSTEKNNT